MPPPLRWGTVSPDTDPEDQAADRVLIFGYGSLINYESRQRTL